jgi:hypothetical protein
MRVWGDLEIGSYIHHPGTAEPFRIAPAESVAYTNLVILKSLTVVGKGTGGIEFFKLFKGLCLCLHDGPTGGKLSWTA